MQVKAKQDDLKRKKMRDQQFSNLTIQAPRKQSIYKGTDDKMSEQKSTMLIVNTDQGDTKDQEEQLRELKDFLDAQNVGGKDKTDRSTIKAVT